MAKMFEKSWYRLKNGARPARKWLAGGWRNGGVLSYPRRRAGENQPGES
jgi:hypothetical protein